MRDRAADEVDRLEAIAHAVQAHRDTLHTLRLPLPPISGGESTSSYGRETDTVVTPPPETRPDGMARWIGRLLRGKRGG